MKNNKYLSLKPFTSYLILTGFLLCAGMKCKKDATGIDALPPATQEGKNTFGCLVNGVAFTPKGSNLGGPRLNCFYQYLNSSTSQGYYFNITCLRNESNSNRGIAINGDSLIIKEGNTYQLKNYSQKNQAYGSYSIVSGAGNINNYMTSGNFIGELYISKLDEVNLIVSGTFWFDAVNDKGEKVEVREGRFDVHYVK
ncbi:MAG: hypothetical protein IE931_02970 [Sphingobacteriales bacterium]|nr:hypothetical protein [Sphingobacteriales bacterium]